MAEFLLYCNTPPEEWGKPIIVSTEEFDHLLEILNNPEPLTPAMIELLRSMPVV